VPDKSLEYVQADLNHEIPSKIGALRGRRFDKILCMDLLEHLTDPGRLLQDCRGLLNSNGTVVISLPNIANISVRLLLLLGRFNYTERGILDRTHVRFFTRATARDFIRGCGFEIVKEVPSVIPLELVLRASHRNPVIRAITACLIVATRIWPTLLGYQFIFAARAKQGLSQR
jgi:hypothetical protein